MSADDWCSVCAPPALKFWHVDREEGCMDSCPIEKWLSSRTTWQINQLRNETSTICRQDGVLSYLLTKPVILRCSSCSRWLPINHHSCRLAKNNTFKTSWAEPPQHGSFEDTFPFFKGETFFIWLQPSVLETFRISYLISYLELSVPLRPAGL